MTDNVTERHELVFENVPVILVVLMRLIATMILLMNGTVLLCLSVKEHNVPKIYTLQMFCLCLTDTMAGMALMVISFLDYSYFREDIVRCCTALGFFLSSQSSSLYNVMLICINRFVTLIRMERREQLTRLRITIYSFCAFLFAFVFCFVPFARWAPSQSEFGHDGCSMETVFRQHMESAMRVFVVSFLVPLVVTNILYGSLFAILRRKQRRIRPDTQISTPMNKVSPAGTNMSNQCNSSIGSNPTAGPSIGTVTFKDPIQTIYTRHNMAASFSKDTSGPPLSERAAVSSSRATLATTRTVQERGTPQSKAFTTLGLILLFLNIFTWPGVLVLVMETMIESWSLSRGSKFPLFCTIGFNSLVNPILYIVRIAEFRTVLLSAFVCSNSRTMRR